MCFEMCCCCWSQETSIAALKDWFELIETRISEFATVFTQWVQPHLIGSKAGPLLRKSQYPKAQRLLWKLDFKLRSSLKDVNTMAAAADLGVWSFWDIRGVSLVMKRFYATCAEPWLLPVTFVWLCQSIYFIRELIGWLDKPLCLRWSFLTSDGFFPASS